MKALVPIEDLFRAFWEKKQPLLEIQRRAGMNLHIRLAKEVQKEIEHAYRMAFAEAAAQIQAQMEGK